MQNGSVNDAAGPYTFTYSGRLDGGRGQRRFLQLLQRLEPDHRLPPGGRDTPVWNGALASGCTGCHGYPPSSGTNHLDANRTGFSNTDTHVPRGAQPVLALPRHRRERPVRGADRVRDAGRQDRSRRGRLSS